MLQVWKYNPHVNQNTRDTWLVAINGDWYFKASQALQSIWSSAVNKQRKQNIPPGNSKKRTDLLTMYCKKDLSNVWSLIVFDHDMDAHSFDTLMSRFKLLRVLDLKRFSNIQQLTDQVVKFYNLMYLNLEGTAVKELPKDTGNLCNLKPWTSGKPKSGCYQRRLPSYQTCVIWLCIT